MISSRKDIGFPDGILKAMLELWLRPYGIQVALAVRGAAKSCPVTWALPTVGT